MQNEHELTPAELKRKENFDKIRADLEERGYKCTELLINLVFANVFSFILFVPVAIISVLLFVFVNRSKDIIDTILGTSPLWYFVFVIALIALIVIHELVHGATWALFTGDGFKSIEFGFIKKYLTPYCTCKVALPKKAYILGALMPLILLGIIPLIISIATGSFGLMWIAIIMVVSAAGDILIVGKILAYKTDASDILYFDHPTDAGGIIFEK